MEFDPETRTSSTVFMVMKQKGRGDVHALHRTAGAFSMWMNGDMLDPIGNHGRWTGFSPPSEHTKGQFQ